MDHKLTYTLALGSLVLTGSALATEPTWTDWKLEGRPNVLVISMDDLGYGQLNFDPSVWNKDLLAKLPVAQRYKVDVDAAIEAAKKSTPTLAALQAQGVTFTQAFVSHGVSGPSRTSFMTAKFASRLGVYSNEDSEAGVSPDELFLPRLFQEYGYETSAFGKWHMAKLRNVPVPPEQKTRDYHDNRSQYASDQTQPQTRGFSHFFGFHGSGASYYNSPALFKDRTNVKAEGYIADQITDEAIKRIERAGDEPFFVYLAYNAPHIPLEKHAPEKYRVFNTGNEEVDKYYEAIYAVDQNVKRVVDLLQKEGKLDNTIVMFWSDNGSVYDAPLPLNGNFVKGNKGQTFNGGVHIPAFISWPARLKPQVYKQMVGTVDFLPTALEAADIPVPQGLDGVPLLKFLQTKKVEGPALTKPIFPVAKAEEAKTEAAQASDKPLLPHEYLIWITPRALHWSVANKDFWEGYDAFIQYKTPDGQNPKGSDYIEKKSPLAWTVRSNQYSLHYSTKEQEFELYDLHNDPREENNLAAQKPQVVQELLDVFKKYLNEQAATPITELNVEKLKALKEQMLTVKVTK